MARDTPKSQLPAKGKQDKGGKNEKEGKDGDKSAKAEQDEDSKRGKQSLTTARRNGKEGSNEPCKQAVKDDTDEEKVFLTSQGKRVHNKNTQGTKQANQKKSRQKSTGDGSDDAVEERASCYEAQGQEVA